MMTRLQATPTDFWLPGRIGVSKRGMLISAAPGSMALLLFYSLAIHTHRSLGGWPEGIGESGFPPALSLHANIATTFFWVSMMVSLWPPGCRAGLPACRTLAAARALFRGVCLRVCFQHHAHAACAGPFYLLVDGLKTVFSNPALRRTHRPILSSGDRRRRWAACAP